MREPQIVTSSPSSQAGTSRSLALLTLLGILWGSSYALAAVALRSIPPNTVVALRVGIATLVLLLFIAWRRSALPRDGATWRSFFVQGTLNPGVPWMLIAWGQQFVGSGLTGVINTLSPVIAVLVVAFWTRHEVITRAKVAGVLLGLTGVAVILGTSVLSGTHDDLLAEFAVLCGTVCFAASAIFGRRFGGLDPAVSATATLLCACAIVIPLSLAIDRPWTLAPSPSALAACLALAVFCTALGFLIYFRLLATIGSTGTTSVSYIRVGVAVLLGAVTLGEPITLKLAIGLACIVVGVVLITRSSTLRPLAERALG